MTDRITGARIQIIVDGKVIAIGTNVTLSTVRSITGVVELNMCCRFHSDGGRTDWDCGKLTWAEWLDAQSISSASKSISS